MVEYRDMSIPYTEEELQALRELICSLPTYKDGNVYADDIPAVVKAMRYERTPEQIQAYDKYWRESFGGSMAVDSFIDYARGVHKTHLIAREFVRDMDKDKNGFISANEFACILQCLGSHDPKLKDKTFEDFVKEADTNRDGVVDIEECVKWIEKYTT